MIGLTKRTKPAILVKEDAKWTKEYLDYLAKGEVPPKALKEKYKHKEIKEEIQLETSDKCAYCESKVGHVYSGDVEHILPHSKNNSLIFQWENLTYACHKCNTSKSDYFDPALYLINPYTDNPVSHFSSIGPMLNYVAGDNRARITEVKIKLNREELILRRAEKLKSLNTLIDEYILETNPLIKNVIKTQLLIEADFDKEYSFVVRQYLVDRCGF